MRASGFVTRGLIPFSVVLGLGLGLVFSLRSRSERWPRRITNAMHTFVPIVALAFGLVHGRFAWLDPWSRLGLAEVLVPFVSHGRPLWLVSGIVSRHLMLPILV